METHRVAFPETICVDHQEICVKNALDMVENLCNVFGFEVAAYAGQQQKRKYTRSYVVSQGSIRFIISEAMRPDSMVYALTSHHGDMIVRDIALLVPDVKVTYDLAVERGAIGIAPPEVRRDAYGSMPMAVIGTCGKVVHTLLERTDYTGVFAPGFVPFHMPHAPGAGLVEVDHTVFNVPRGQKDPWVQSYEETLGFKRIAEFSEELISTGRAALRSTVVRNSNGRITFPINEPVKGKHSHIDDFLRAKKGAGVQHIAFRTDDIITTVNTLKERGARFLSIPRAYYDDVRRRYGDINVDFDALERLGILIDQDEKGHLLQVFTKPIYGEDGLFFEIIQRCGSDGFGAGNFLRLFQAIERDKGRF